MPLTLAQGWSDQRRKTNRRKGRSSALLKFTRFYRRQRGHARFAEPGQCHRQGEGVPRGHQ